MEHVKRTLEETDAMHGFRSAWWTKAGMLVSQ